MILFSRYNSAFLLREVQDPHRSPRDLMETLLEWGWEGRRELGPAAGFVGGGCSCQDICGVASATSRSWEKKEQGLYSFYLSPPF